MDSPVTDAECLKRATCPLNEAIDQLIEDFELFDDWEDRYRYILELGEELPDMPEEEKVASNRVEGCMSTVWMVARLIPASPPIMQLTADSDSMIVKGLIAILTRVYSGRTPEEILSCDIHCLFDRLQLRKHLSSQRRNGLHAMIKRVQHLAETAA